MWAHKFGRILLDIWYGIPGVGVRDVEGKANGRRTANVLLESKSRFEECFWECRRFLDESPNRRRRFRGRKNATGSMPRLFLPWENSVNFGAVRSRRYRWRAERAIRKPAYDILVSALT